MISLLIQFHTFPDIKSGNKQINPVKIVLDHSTERLNAFLLNEIEGYLGGIFSIPLRLTYLQYQQALSLCTNNSRLNWSNIKFIIPLEFQKFVDSNSSIKNITITNRLDSYVGDKQQSSPKADCKLTQEHLVPVGLAFSDIRNGRFFPKIGIVLRQWEALEYSKNCINDILKAGYPNLELYLIDDASIDGSYLELKFLYPEIKVIRFLERQEYTRCLNVGAEVAINNECDFLFFTNNDTRGFKSSTSHDFFTNLLLEFSGNTNLGLVCPRVMDWTGANIEKRTSKKLGIVFDIATEAYLIPVSLWKAINGFDNSLVRYCEDMMMLERIKALGYLATICPQSTFSHFGMGSSAKQVVIPTYYRVRNGVIILKKTISMREKDFYAYLYKWIRPHILLIQKELQKLWVLRAIVRILSLFLGLIIGFKSKYTPSEDWRQARNVLTTPSISLLKIDRFFEKKFRIKER